jgi:hypothetical protein
LRVGRIAKGAVIAADVVEKVGVPARRCYEFDQALLLSRYLRLDARARRRVVPMPSSAFVVLAPARFFAAFFSRAATAQRTRTVTDVPAS